jgi:hypothetical protein
MNVGKLLSVDFDEPRAGRMVMQIETDNQTVWDGQVYWTMREDAAIPQRERCNYEKEICDLRALLVCVLQEEEVANGFGSGALSKELIFEIENVLAKRITNVPESPDSSQEVSA